MKAGDSDEGCNLALCMLLGPVGRHQRQAEAISMLLDLKSKISTQEDFADVAGEHSDCGSARSGGDLGDFGDGQMMKVSAKPLWCLLRVAPLVVVPDTAVVPGMIYNTAFAAFITALKSSATKTHTKVQ